MRLVSWNMGRSRKTHEAAWHYLLSWLSPDVACVQEALSSADRLVAARGSITWSKARPGGTGVFVRRGIAISPIPSSLTGSYVAAVTASWPAGAIRVFSVHVGPESWKNQEAFEPWLVDQIQSKPSVVAGDINTSRAYSSKHRAYLD